MAAGPERAKRVLGGLCVLGALALVSGIYGGLVGNPESMQQAHHLTGRTMAWYSDLAKNGFLDAWWFSLPIWAWRGMMLVWALAMVKGLTNMLPKAWARWRVLADKGPA